MNALTIFCNLIPALIVLYYFFRGWERGALYLVASLAKYYLSFFIARFASVYVADFLMQNTNIKSYAINFALEHQSEITKLPGAFFLFTGTDIQQNIEGIAWWILNLASFFIILIVLSIIFSIILRLFVKLNKIPVLGFFNQALGGFTGIVLGLGIALVLTYFFAIFFNLIGETEISQALLSSWLPVLFRKYI